MSAQDAMREALKEMMQAIKTGEGDIAGIVRRIDELNTAIGADAPPMLRHYLDRRSYEKALAFLEGRDESAAPNC